jgi:hypothetical protein
MELATETLHVYLRRKPKGRLSLEHIPLDGKAYLRVGKINAGPTIASLQ